MDSLFSYCSASETFENTIDIVSSLEKQDKTSASMMGGELYERSTPNIRNEMLELKQLNQQLLEQLDDRQKLLDHTKSQLSFYRGNIETLEDEYTRMNKALTSAENEIAEYKVLVAKHEATIASLKNDLESFYDLEKRQNLSITDEKLSFSDEISTSNHSNRSGKKEGDGANQSGPGDQVTIIKTLEKVCNENMDLKRENSSLAEELRLLKKDTQDYENFMFRGPPDFAPASKSMRTGVEHLAKNNFAISTPIKKKTSKDSILQPPKAEPNYISYKDLNLNLSQYSIDEDDDNLQQHYKLKTPVQGNRKSLEIFQSNKFSDIKPIIHSAAPSCKSDLYRLPMGECENLADESMPTYFADNTLMTLSATPFSGRAYTNQQTDEFNTLSTAGTQISSIVDEMMPLVDISTSTANITTTDSKGSSGTTTPSTEENTQIEVTKIQLSMIKHKQADHEQQQNILPSKEVDDGKQQPEIMLTKEVTEPSPPNAFPHMLPKAILPFLLILFMLFTFTIILLWSLQNTRLLPFYSLEEIFFDLVVQYSYAR